MSTDGLSFSNNQQLPPSRSSFQCLNDGLQESVNSFLSKVLTCTSFDFELNDCALTSHAISNLSLRFA